MPSRWAHTSPFQSDNTSSGYRAGEADVHNEQWPSGQYLRPFPKQTATSRLWMSETWAATRFRSCIWQPARVKLQSVCCVWMSCILSSSIVYVPLVHHPTCNISQWPSCMEFTMESSGMNRGQYAGSKTPMVWNVSLGKCRTNNSGESHLLLNKKALTDVFQHPVVNLHKNTLRGADDECKPMAKCLIPSRRILWSQNISPPTQMVKCHSWCHRYQQESISAAYCVLTDRLSVTKGFSLELWVLATKMNLVPLVSSFFVLYCSNSC